MFKIFIIYQCNIMIWNRYFIQIVVLYLVTRLLTSHRDRYQNVVIYLLKQKNQKIVNLIKRKRKPCNTNYSAPIINLSNYNLSSQETQQLKLGLDYCFVDKNKDVRRFLAANMESLADSVKGNIDHQNLEHFHILLLLVYKIVDFINRSMRYKWLIVISYKGVLIGVP